MPDPRIGTYDPRVGNHNVYVVFKFPWHANAHVFPRPLIKRIPVTPTL
jgi:hypothetical protein